MTIKLHKRVLAFLLTFVCLAPCLAVRAADNEGFFCSKTAQMQPDGSCRITLQAYQTGYVAPTDIVMVLDVSGSMEYSTPVPSSQIDPAKDYYIKYRHTIEIDGSTFTKEDNIRVHNESAPGETPAWFGVLEDGQAPTQVYPTSSGAETEYTFYTGAMEALRKAAADFTDSVAANAAENGAAHRIAVVEFSSPEAKGAAKCTHDNPYFANILSGSGTPAGALVSATAQQTHLHDIFASLTAAGPTYSDDALAQAEAILSADSTRSQIVILFTDGGPGSYGWQYDIDDSALPTANAAIAAAGRMKARGVRIYTIGVFNEENLYGEVGEKNTTYLGCISSDYPQATAMDAPGERMATRYCSIGDLQMDLRSAFSDISAVIGTPVERAQVLDTVSAYFYMTDAQKQALRQAYPAVQILENADGTTTIRLDDRDFPPVSVLPDGTPVSAEDENIFTMTFDVTPRDTLLGGNSIQTNTGNCGVFAEGIQIASFASPAVDVPIDASRLAGLFRTEALTVYRGQLLSAEQLYTDLSDSVFAPGAQIAFRVTDAEGGAFTSGIPQESTTFTVTAVVTVGDETFTYDRIVPVQVVEDTPQALVLTALPAKRSYFVGDTLDTAGLAAEVRYDSGKTEPLTAADWSLSPTSFANAGTQTVTVTVKGLRASFTVDVQAVRAERLEILSAPNASSFVYRRSPDFTGLRVRIVYNNGTGRTTDDLSELRIERVSAQRIRRGAVTFRVSAEGTSATFDMRARLVWWQWLILIFLFGWIWY